MTAHDPLPALSPAEIRTMRTIPKRVVGRRGAKGVERDWIAELLEQVDHGGIHWIGLTTVLDNTPLPASMNNGSFEVGARRGIAPHDYSALLRFTFATGAAVMIMRVNGPHTSPHTNRIDGRANANFTAVPHTHYLTAQCLRRHIEGQRIAPEQFAVARRHNQNPSNAGSLEGLRRALIHLGRRGRIVHQHTFFADP